MTEDVVIFPTQHCKNKEVSCVQSHFVCKLIIFVDSKDFKHLFLEFGQKASKEL